LLKKIVLLAALKPHFDGAISENENLVSLWEKCGRREKWPLHFLRFSRREDKLSHVTPSVVGTVNRLQDLDDPDFGIRESQEIFLLFKIPIPFLDLTQ